jgi:hypothetical protein
MTTTKAAVNAKQNNLAAFLQAFSKFMFRSRLWSFSAFNDKITVKVSGQEGFVQLFDRQDKAPGPLETFTPRRLPAFTKTPPCAIISMITQALTC